jgi:DNA mismatch endonuclease (patch repair protein)
VGACNHHTTREAHLTQVLPTFVYVTTRGPSTTRRVNRRAPAACLKVKWVLNRPIPASPEVAQRMARTRQRDTDGEMAVRRAVHRRGLRYRVNAAIKGAGRIRPDLVFPSEEVAVFVDGCFWHRCPQHATTPKNNRSWWEEKLAGNVERDQRHNEVLRSLGWEVLRFWEHADAKQAAAEIERAVVGRRRPT